MQLGVDDEMKFLPLGREYLEALQSFESPHKAANSIAKAQKDALAPKEAKAKAKSTTRKRKGA